MRREVIYNQSEDVSICLEEGQVVAEVKNTIEASYWLKTGVFITDDDLVGYLKEYEFLAQNGYTSNPKFRTLEKAIETYFRMSYADAKIIAKDYVFRKAAYKWAGLE